MENNCMVLAFFYSIIFIFIFPQQYYQGVLMFDDLQFYIEEILSNTFETCGFSPLGYSSENSSERNSSIVSESVKGTSSKGFSKKISLKKSGVHTQCPEASLLFSPGLEDQIIQRGGDRKKNGPKMLPYQKKTENLAVKNQNSLHAEYSGRDPIRYRYSDQISVNSQSVYLNKINMGSQLGKYERDTNFSSKASQNTALQCQIRNSLRLSAHSDFPGLSQQKSVPAPNYRMAAPKQSQANRKTMNNEGFAPKTNLEGKTEREESSADYRRNLKASFIQDLQYL